MGKAGVSVAETYEEEGIIYFEEPYKTDLWAWLDTHIGLEDRKSVV